jgi:hypothetical protein
MTEFLTYEEAAAILGVTAEAIRCRAKRGHWRRRVDNDGKARIVLPDGITRLPRPPGDHPVATGQRPASDHPDDMRVRLAAAEAELSALRDHLLDLRQERDRLIEDRDHWRRQAEAGPERRSRDPVVTAILTRMREKASAKSAA